MGDEDDSREAEGKVNASVFADDRWFTDRSKSSFWLRIYTFLGVSKDDVSKKSENAIRELFYGVPIRIRYAYLSESEWPVWTQYLVSGDDPGIPRIQLKEEKRPFPGSTCVFISMPFVVDGVIPDPDKITKALSIIPSVIVAHIGKNTLRDIVFDGVIEAHNGN